MQSYPKSWQKLSLLQDEADKLIVFGTPGDGARSRGLAAPTRDHCIHGRQADMTC